MSTCISAMTCARLLNLRSLCDIPRHHQLHHVRHDKYPKPHIHIPQPKSHKRCPAIRGKPDRITHQIYDADARQIHSRHMVIHSRQNMSVEHGKYSPCRTACRTYHPRKPAYLTPLKPRGIRQDTKEQYIYCRANKQCYEHCYLCNI